MGLSNNPILYAAQNASRFEFDPETLKNQRTAAAIDVFSQCSFLVRKFYMGYASSAHIMLRLLDIAQYFNQAFAVVDYKPNVFEKHGPSDSLNELNINIRDGDFTQAIESYRSDQVGLMYGLPTRNIINKTKVSQIAHLMAINKLVNTKNVVTLELAVAEADCHLHKKHMGLQETYDTVITFSEDGDHLLPYKPGQDKIFANALAAPNGLEKTRYYSQNKFYDFMSSEYHLTRDQTLLYWALTTDNSCKRSNDLYIIEGKRFNSVAYETVKKFNLNIEKIIDHIITVVYSSCNHEYTHIKREHLQKSLAKTFYQLCLEGAEIEYLNLTCSKDLDTAVNNFYNKLLNRKLNLQKQKDIHLLHILLGNLKEDAPFPKDFPKLWQAECDAIAKTVVLPEGLILKAESSYPILMIEAESESMWGYSTRTNLHGRQENYQPLVTSVERSAKMSLECVDTNNVSEATLFDFANTKTTAAHNETNRKRKRTDHICNCVICDEPINMRGYQNHINAHVRVCIEEDLLWRIKLAVGQLVHKYHRRFQRLQAIVLGWVKH
ncbi:hypothetical protein E3Q18_03602 [Wallemia mellicola]|nr:hypothetical protein E3Q18_03602 [Wallemia mellicola]